MRRGRKLPFLLASVAIVFTALNLFVGRHVAHHDKDGSSSSTSTTTQAFKQGNDAADVVSSGVLEQNRQVKGNQITTRRLPPIESIITGKWNITGNAAWLLDFSIIGFPKTGTSTLMFHLGEHPEILTFKDERCDISNNQQAKLIRDLYNLPTADDADADDGRQYVVKRGIKCPFDLENTKLAMPNYQQFFPNTKYIVGIRHPVLWFESFYNFRVQNQFPILPPEKLIGKCRKGSFNVCTFRSNFHLFLSNLGKTNMSTSKEEQAYLDESVLKSMSPLKYNQQQRVFLYEVTQLSDLDERRATQLRKDLQTFLGLREPISPMMWYKPGRKHEDQQTIDEVNSKKIDICDQKYAKLREVLQKQAVDASRWICKYFIVSPDVTVSSKQYFSDVLMKSWERDPCLDRINNPKEKKNRRLL